MDLGTFFHFSLNILSFIVYHLSFKIFIFALKTTLSLWN